MQETYEKTTQKTIERATILGKRGVEWSIDRLKKE